ncbi:MAG: glycosyltransferase [Parcubacteria group bacterium]|nr:glycosyltransferase [Parcubacteria group bacterium]
MQNIPKLSIIVPAYNEEKTVGKVLKRLLAVPFPGWETEVIVVNDASTDGTLAAMKVFSPRIRIINLPKNSGKGSAVNAALAVADGDFAIIQDADLECKPEEIPLLLKALEPQRKVAVIGSRETHAKNPKKKTLSRFGSLSITKLINLFYGSALTDASMCYKLFPKSAFGYFDAGGFEAELLFILRLLQNGYRIVEVPVSYTPRETSDGKKIRYRDGMKIIGRILWFRISGK